MKKLLLSASIALCGTLAAPRVAAACDVPSCSCSKMKSTAKAGDAKKETATSDNKNKKEKCDPNSAECAGKGATCTCQKCGMDKVGFNLHSESRTLVARDASAGMRI
jgi:hypothetical protein